MFVEILNTHFSKYSETEGAFTAITICDTSQRPSCVLQGNQQLDLHLWLDVFYGGKKKRFSNCIKRARVSRGCQVVSDARLTHCYHIVIWLVQIQVCLFQLPLILYIICCYLFNFKLFYFFCFMGFFLSFFFWVWYLTKRPNLQVSFSSDLDIVCVNCIERILINRKTQLSSGEHDTFISFFSGIDERHKLQ